VDFGIAGVATNFNVENIDAGSLKYMSPELLSGKLKQIAPSVDVWAIGVILYGMLTAELPFDGSNNRQIVEKIITGEWSLPKLVDKKISKECKDMLTRLMKVDPNHRINLTEVLNHPWIQ